MKKIKKWDTVQVIAGKYKTKTWVVEASLPDAVVVAGVNVMKRATKWKGFVEKTHPIHISNVAYYDTETQQASKIRIVTTAEGKKKRQIVKTWRTLAK